MIEETEMLESTEERVKLLKAGIDSKTIEKLYIENNSFKIVNKILFEDYSREISDKDKLI